VDILPIEFWQISVQMVDQPEQALSTPNDFGDVLPAKLCFVTRRNLHTETDWIIGFNLP